MLTRESLRQAFGAMGLQPSDIVLLHSSYKALGPVEGGPATVITALREVLGPHGTLVVPTFTFAFSDVGAPFDARTTRSEMGVLTEIVRVLPDAARTVHPVYSYAAVGAYAREISAIHNTTSYGDDSVLGWARRRNAWIVIIGLPYSQSLTFAHHVEEMARAPYRFDKQFSGDVRGRTGEPLIAPWSIYVRDRDHGIVTYLEPMYEVLERRGLIGVHQVGQARVKAMRAAPVYDASAEHLRTFGGYGAFYRVEWPAPATGSDEELAKTLLSTLWPICRSIAGPGYRHSLEILDRVMPTRPLLFETGRRVLDWEVPEEWAPRAAWIEAPDGRRLADFADHSLHLVSHSVPIDAILTREALDPHLHSLPAEPEAIPYVTAYYERTWGFCLPHRERVALSPGDYRVHIDAERRPGFIQVGEAVLPGTSTREILLSTYLCHPSMANNELSGPVVTALLYRRLAAWPTRRLTVRFVVCPETIGAVCYLSERGEHLARHLDAGFVVTCVGGHGLYTYKRSRHGHAIPDRAVAQLRMGVLSVPYDPTRGSDERQYGSPAYNLPVGSLMRMPYGEYPEYHTSLDTLTLTPPKALVEVVDLYETLVRWIDGNVTWARVDGRGEPQLGRRGLYGGAGGQGEQPQDRRALLWLLNLADGTRDLLAIAEQSGMSMDALLLAAETLAQSQLIRAVA